MEKHSSLISLRKLEKNYLKTAPSAIITTAQ